MNHFFIPLHIGRWLRRYGILMLLLGILAADLIAVALSGMGPRPQLPPNGYVEERGAVTLQWNRGNIEKPITLQVSTTKSFDALVEETTVSGTTHTYNREMQRGQTYFWRLMQDGVPSATAHFVISTHHVNL
jgi:hypothetical protein